MDHWLVSYAIQWAAAKETLLVWFGKCHFEGKTELKSASWESWKGGSSTAILSEAKWMWTGRDCLRDYRQVWFCVSLWVIPGLFNWVILGQGAAETSSWRQAYKRRPWALAVFSLLSVTCWLLPEEAARKGIGPFAVTVQGCSCGEWMVPTVLSWEWWNLLETRRVGIRKPLWVK